MLSVVIPAYNAAAVIDDTISKINNFFETQIEIIVVNDGSADTTGQVLAERPPAENFRVINFDQNRGKGAAVKAGVEAASGEYIAFTDADLPYGLEPLREMQSVLENGGAEIVVGSRSHNGAYETASNGPLRVLTSFLWSACVSGLTGEFKDTQCGIKMFRHDAARQIFSALKTDGFAFDVEIFAIARRLGLKVAETPVRQICPSRYSTVRILRDGVKMAHDLVQIRRRYKI